MIQGIAASKSKTFLAFCFCFLIGVAIGSIVNQRIDFVYIYTVLSVIVPMGVMARKDAVHLFFAVCSLLIVIGFARYSLALPQPLDLPRDEQTFIATVASEPDVRQDGVRYIAEVISHKSKVISQIGKIYFKSNLYPRYQYGDVLQVTCKLQKPAPFDGFRYDMYLTKLGVQATCQRTEIGRIRTRDGNPALERIYALKQKTAERINELWHEPYAGFMAGLLYGYRGGLGTLSEQFNRTGVTHIIAISGYNISIIAQILIIACSYLWIPRKKAFWLVTGGLILFVFFAGLTGSVIRAGIMGFLVILAKQLGRLNRIGNAMAFTAALMTLHNPFLLIWDAGFQLSFLATLGLIYLSPIIETNLERLPTNFHDRDNWLARFIGRVLGSASKMYSVKETFVATASAIVATLPLLSYQFGRVSIVAIIVNVLVLWIIPYLMLLGFGSVIISFIFYPLGQALAWTAWLGMKYVTAIVAGFSELPFAALEFRLSAPFMLLLYLIMIVLIQKSTAREKFVHLKSPGG